MARRPGTFLLLCALWSLPASAQSLKIPTIVFAGAATADLTTTYLNLSAPGIEENPALKWTRNDALMTVAAGAVLTSVGVWMWNRCVGRRHPRLARLGLYIGAAIEVGVAARNIHRHQ